MRLGYAHGNLVGKWKKGDGECSSLCFMSVSVSGALALNAQTWQVVGLTIPLSDVAASQSSVMRQTSEVHCLMKVEGHAGNLPVAHASPTNGFLAKTWPHHVTDYQVRPEPCCMPWSVTQSSTNTTSRYPSSTLLPFLFGVSLLKLNSRRKGTLIIKGLLGNLDLA